MNSHPNFHRACRVLLLAWIAATTPFVRASDTSFTYQGRLTASGDSAGGAFDFVVTLHDSAAGGIQLGGAVTNLNVAVGGGLFTVPLDFGPNVFNGQARWLQIAVRSNTASATFETLTPRQQVTAVPVALHAGSSATAAAVAAGSVGAVALQDGSILQEKIAPGQVVRSLNGLHDDVTVAAGSGVTLTSNANGLVIGSTAWSVDGNGGTSPLTQFLGTTDNQPLELRVNNTRALRIEPTPSGPGINIIGGCKDNYVRPGISAATIAGGGINYGTDFTWSNSVSAPYATIGGGVANAIDINASSGIIAGGFSNRLGYFVAEGVIAGGSLNTIEHDALRATIGGGWQHTIGADCYHSTIAGGWTNVIYGNSSTISGGIENAVGAGARFSTIGGGAGNVIQDGAITGTIAGGGQNSIGSDSWRGVIGGGKGNQIGTNSLHSTIGGGTTNLIRDNTEAAVIPGGSYNIVGGAYGFAAGRRATAAHPGSFVWADSTDSDFGSTANNEFAVRSTGGIRMVTGLDGSGSPLSGVAVAAGSGTWSTLSDRNAKENFASVDPEEILDKVAALPLQTWNYKAQGNAVRHLGPVAQDFHAAFALGENETTIPTVDADGVALAAIQGLNRKLETELKRKDAEIQDLRRNLAELKHLIVEGGAHN